MLSLSLANEYLIIHADNYSEVDLIDFVQVYKKNLEIIKNIKCNTWF